MAITSQGAKAKPDTSHITGMECDNPNCSFEDKSVTLDQYDAYVDKPCPECGESLLTEKDNAQIHFMLEILGIIKENRLATDETNGDDL